MQTEKSVHKGRCHCGDVTFTVNAPTEVTVLRCNCSICRMTGFVHLIVAEDALKIISGSDALSHYRFGSKKAQHLFCSTCGVKPFYRPRSHPDGWSINVNCLDTGSFSSIDYQDFDGANWEDNINSIQGY